MTKRLCRAILEERTHNCKKFQSKGPGRYMYTFRREAEKKCVMLDCVGIGSQCSGVRVGRSEPQVEEDCSSTLLFREGSGCPRQSGAGVEVNGTCKLWATVGMDAGVVDS